jgi:hypothetical protein
MTDCVVHYDACACRKAQFEQQDYNLTIANQQIIRMSEKMQRLEQALLDIETRTTDPHAKRLASSILKVAR